MEGVIVVAASAVSFNPASSSLTCKVSSCLLVLVTYHHEEGRR